MLPSRMLPHLLVRRRSSCDSLRPIMAMYRESLSSTVLTTYSCRSAPKAVSISSRNTTTASLASWSIRCSTSLVSTRPALPARRPTPRVAFVVPSRVMIMLVGFTPCRRSATTVPNISLALPSLWMTFTLHSARLNFSAQCFLLILTQELR